MKWPLVKLQELVDINIGRTPSRDNADYWGEGLPWLSIRDMNQGKILSKTAEQITALAVQDAKCKIAKKGTVLFSFKLSIGKVGIAHVDMFHNEAIAAMPIKQGVELCTEYLYFALMQMDSAKSTDRAVMGATLNKKKMAELKIPLPPLETQKKIAVVLEKADQLRKDCLQMEQELNNLAQSVFIDMFGDPVTNPNGFEVTKLKDLVSVLSGATPSKSNDSFWVGDVPWVSPKDMKVPELYDAIDHVNEITFTETNLKSIPLNSILIVVRGMILAHTVPLAITRKKLAINQDIKALTVKSEFITNEFLLAALSSMHAHLLGIVSTAAHGTKRIDMEDLLNIRVIVPSLKSQEEYTKAIKVIRELLANQKAEAALYESNFNALMQKAFKGELNL
ncbi:restriction endonuclease subunit S [Vibrio breoganii]|uniref:restriction endonuclease subunit S n=1 Tax=Vibrio breoganii TaxID=553239 RepID=UPI0002E4283C|nr:restriction endonuclease subunit S [Vibrio breoganii]OED94292.1 hypothetical protein A1QG_05985 [Vibrio breoganii ZF-29]